LKAPKIENLLRINRKTINRIIKLIGERIAEIAEKESVFSRDRGVIFWSQKSKRKERQRICVKTKVFGKKKRGDKEYKQIVKNCSAQELVSIIKSLTSKNLEYIQMNGKDIMD
jgi:transposase